MAVPTTRPTVRSGSGTRGAPLRFILAGGLNTAVTFVLYVTLLAFLPHPVAYSVTFMVGVVLSYLLNRSFVFKSVGGVTTMLLFPMVYVVQYLVGLLVVLVWVDILGLPAELASIAAVIVTLPITYGLLRWVFVTRHEPSERTASGTDLASGRSGDPAASGHGDKTHD
jgi:putative flippase GtrA